MRRAILIIFAAVLLAACAGSNTGPANGSHTFSVRVSDAQGNTEAVPATRSFRAQVPSQPFPGIRFYKTVGIAERDCVVVSAFRVDRSVDHNTYMKPAYHDTDGSVDFVVQTPLRWEDVLVNERVVPTHAQMSNPNWSGYKWDTPNTNASEIDAC